MARHRPTRARTPGCGLEEFEPFSVLQGAAVLALWPPNADRHIALGALVAGLARMPEARDRRGRTRSPISPGNWRRWLAGRSSKILRAIQPDGIHDAPLSVPAALRGHGAHLLAGALDGPDLLFAMWLDALDAAGESRADSALADASAVLTEVARMSDRIVDRGRFGSFPWPHHRDDKAISVPDDATFASLSAALLFDAAELDLKALAPLVRTGQAVDAARPLVFAPGGGVLVADPWTLTCSALGAASAYARSSRQHAAFVEALTAAACDVARDAAADMDWTVEAFDGLALVARADRDCLVVWSAFAAVPVADGVAGTRALDAALADRVCELVAVAERRGADHALLVVVGDGRSLTLPPDHQLLSGHQPLTPWLVGVAELRLLGDALRRDPLALPSALVPSARPPWPDGLDLVDIAGSSRRLEEPVHERKHLPVDGTEHLRLRARQMAARHVAPTADARAWAELTRWGGSPDHRLFAVSTDAGLALVARHRGRTLYVRAADPTTARSDVGGVITLMLAHWMARLAAHGWPHVPAPLQADEVVMAFCVEVAREPGPALVVAGDDEVIRVVAGPGFIHAMCRGDNVADRDLLRAVVAAAGDRSSDEQDELVDRVAPRGRGTFVIWPAPELDVNPPRLLPPPLVAPRDRRDAELAVASALAKPEDIYAFSGQSAARPLADVLEVVDRGLAQLVAELEPGALVDLVGLHEQALVQRAAEAAGMLARVELMAADEHLGPREAVGGRDLVLRALVERVSAMPPAGTAPLSQRRAGRLRAMTALGIELGSARDAVLSNQADATLAVGPQIGVFIGVRGDLADAGARTADQLAADGPEAMLREHRAWWDSDAATDPEPRLVLDVPIELGARLRAVDRALGAEWGVGFEQLVRLTRAISDLADAEAEAVLVTTSEELVERLSSLTAIPDAAIVSALDQLVLEPRTDFSATARPHRPWWPNRDRSYLRRPIVALADGHLAASSLHMLQSARYLYGLIEGGRLRGGRALRLAVGHVSQESDREFEAALAECCAELSWDVRSRVKRLGGLKLEREPGQPIGDIDVLAWSPERRRVWLLDAKRLAPGLEPRAIARERDGLGKHAGHHRERLTWVRAHLDCLSRELGEDVTADWSIAAALVLDRPLVGAHLGNHDLPVWTFSELAARLTDPGPAGRAAGKPGTVAWPS